jgi:hypothetical protein
VNPSLSESKAASSGPHITCPFELRNFASIAVPKAFLLPPPAGLTWQLAHLNATPFGICPTRSELAIDSEYINIPNNTYKPKNLNINTPIQNIILINIF